MFETLLDRLSAHDAADDRRDPQPREAVAWVAEIEFEGRRHPIEIGNISAGGLMAHVGICVPPQTPLALWIDGERLTGEVRWYGDGRFGLRFDTQLTRDAAIIQRYLPASIAAAKQMSRWMV